MYMLCRIDHYRCPITLTLYQFPVNSDSEVEGRRVDEPRFCTAEITVSHAEVKLIACIAGYARSARLESTHQVRKAILQEKPSLGACADALLQP
nr:hypothetical protein CFP56_54455 [Quercus suber]